jgi:hypothetical protein
LDATPLVRVDLLADLGTVYPDAGVGHFSVSMGHVRVRSPQWARVGGVHLLNPVVEGLGCTIGPIQKSVSIIKAEWLTLQSLWSFTSQGVF